jgi:AbrB family looped-hinge helix DNA binding protein
MNTSRITSKGQVTVPKRFRDQLGWKPGDELEFIRVDGGLHVVMAVHRRRGAEAVRRLARVKWKKKLSTTRLMEITRGYEA